MRRGVFARSRFLCLGLFEISHCEHTLQRFLYSAAGGIFPFSASPLGSKFSFRPFSYVPSCGPRFLQGTACRSSFDAEVQARAGVHQKLALGEVCLRDFRKEHRTRKRRFYGRKGQNDSLENKTDVKNQLHLEGFQEINFFKAFPELDPRKWEAFWGNALN